MPTTQAILAYDTGNTVAVALYTSAGAAVGSPPTIAETPSGSGRYVYTFPSIAADTYTAIYSSGGYIVGSEKINWDGTQIVTAAAAGNTAISTQITVVRTQ